MSAEDGLGDVLRLLQLGQELLAAVAIEEPHRTLARHRELEVVTLTNRERQPGGSNQ